MTLTGAVGSVQPVSDDDGADDLFGWSKPELVSIARWYLMRGYDLAGGDETWQMDFSYDRGVSCGGLRPVDEHLVAEGRRLLAYVYPNTRITLRRRSLTEHERTWSDRPDRRW